MYLKTIRYGIMYAVSISSRFMESPNRTGKHVGKMQILRYVVGTTVGH